MTDCLYSTNSTHGTAYGSISWPDIENRHANHGGHFESPHLKLEFFFQGAEDG
jgi:hypothetical protein